MNDWIDYYDSTHTIYVSRKHRDEHFRLIASNIIGYISSPDATVLDYACGEALFAANVADSSSKLILAEPAPGVRGRLVARFSPNTKIRVRALDELKYLDAASIDLAVMISVAQYMTPKEFGDALVMMKRLLKPTGRLVVGDILDPNVGTLPDVMALLRFASAHGFLKDALIGLVRTALSDYWSLRQRVGLQRYSEQDMLALLSAAGFVATRSQINVGHNPSRMTFVARHSFERMGEMTR